MNSGGLGRETKTIADYHHETLFTISCFFTVIAQRIGDGAEHPYGGTDPDSNGSKAITRGVYGYACKLPAELCAADTHYGYGADKYECGGGGCAYECSLCRLLWQNDNEICFLF